MLRLILSGDTYEKLVCNLTDTPIGVPLEPVVLLTVHDLCDDLLGDGDNSPSTGESVLTAASR
jgi:hypothetical protein